MRNIQITEKKQVLLDEFNNTPFVIGEQVSFKESLTSRYVKDDNKLISGKIIDINGDEIKVQYVWGRPHNITLTKDDIKFRYDIEKVGANPFVEKGGKITSLNYSLDSIIFMFNLDNNGRIDKYEFDGVLCNEVNWNPFVYDKNGNKQYYQRDFCWTLKEKQSIINSIYNNVSLGMVLVRKRGWKEIEKMRANGETELAFTDIVDGKQRLNTIREYLTNQFPDSYGNYFDDLSAYSQNKLTNNGLLHYGEMPEFTTDEDVLYQFLKVNFAGIPQSIEHIEYVKSLLNK